MPILQPPLLKFYIIYQLVLSQITTPSSVKHFDFKLKEVSTPGANISSLLIYKAFFAWCIKTLLWNFSLFVMNLGCCSQGSQGLFTFVLINLFLVIDYLFVKFFKFTISGGTFPFKIMTRL
jgi:hypothetical protein